MTHSGKSPPGRCKGLTLDSTGTSTVPTWTQKVEAQNQDGAKSVRLVMYTNRGTESHGCLSWHYEYKLGSAESISVTQWTKKSKDKSRAFHGQNFFSK